MDIETGVPVETLLPFVFVGLFLLLAVVSVVVGLRQLRRARENLTWLGREMDLPLVHPPARPLLGRGLPRIEGTWRGRRVKVFAYATGSGKQRTHWRAALALAQNPGGLTLRISTENILTRAGRKLGLDDMRVGDATFDGQFYVKSSDAAYIRAALIPEVRARFFGCWNEGAKGTIHVEGNEVKYAEQGSFSGRRVVERFPRLVQLVCDMAEIVEAHR